MEKYNYPEAVASDVREFINNEITLSDYSSREELEEYLCDRLWAADSVTGNASGFYTFNAWQAEENLCHNLDLLAEACESFGSDAAKLLADGAEACDVAIRCYLLSQAVTVVLDSLEYDFSGEEVA